MNKLDIKTLLIKILTKDYEALVATAHEAKNAATNSESKAENKYDTRGLEASYLAGAQAKRAEELRVVIDKLSKLDITNTTSKSRIDIASLVEVRDRDDRIKTFFILPFAGGTKLSFEGTEILVISAISPVGKLLIGLKQGEDFTTRINGTTTEYEIISVN